MPETSILKEYGLGIFLAVGNIALLFLIVKWTLSTTKDILNQSAKERECWHNSIMKVNQAIDDHTAQAKEFHSTVNEAHRYQREEHKEMIGQLKEITISLGRINGYRDEPHKG
jgi:uncharacterized coiled-coil DUF342 family protein